MNANPRVTGLVLLLPLICVLVCLVPAQIYAQAGSVDTSYNPGSGVNDNISAIALQTDNKLLIGGQFTTVGSVSRNHIARLNADGGLDVGFDPGAGANNDVNAVAVQADGKILLGGAFTTVNGYTRNHIARLNADGALDASFDPGTGAGLEPGGNANIYIDSITVQTDGKIILGGDFTTINGVAIHRIARLNTDGSLDASFNPGSGSDGNVGSVAVQTDGKILLGGGFSFINGSPRKGIARLNTDGSLDASFNPGASANDTRSVVVQADGKILLGGAFATVNGSTRNHVARLNADGTLDASFDPGLGVNGFSVLSVAVQTDGKIVLGGQFNTVSGVSRNYIARLNADGSLDASFDPGTGANNDVRTVAVQADGKILLGGIFTIFNGSTRNHVARLNGGSPGTLQFSAANYSVNENAGSAIISVSRTSGSVGAVSIHYATANGTAIAGTDYQSASGTLSWTDGDTASKTFAVPIIDRGITDGSTRAISLALSSAAGGASIGSSATAALTIQENDPVAPPVGMVALSQASYSVVENAGSVTITATRTGGSAGAVSVNFATSAGTASAGVRYQNVSGTLFWANGDAQPKSFLVPILNDSVADGDQTVLLSLSAPTGGTALGNPAQAVLTIQDDGDTTTLPPTGDFIQAVNLLSPPTNITVLAGQPLDLYVSVDATSGALRGVEFFAGNISLGGSSAARDHKTWIPPGPGDFVLRTVATDVNGAQKSSFETIHVALPASNVTAPLSALLSGLDGKTFAVGSTIPLVAATADAQGALTSVQFYVDGKPLNASALNPAAREASGNSRGIVRKDASTSAPAYQGTSLIADAVGDRLLTFAATNSQGITAVSAGATIHVASAPNDAAFSCTIASPSASGQVPARTRASAAVAAAKPGGQVSKVEFFVNSTSVGSALAAPYNFTLPPLEPGAYALTAIATDESGFNKVSSPVIVTASTSAAAAAPAVSSASVSAQVGVPFSYQIVGANSPTSYSASGLPAGLTLDTASGIISGTPTQAGSVQVSLGATNAAGTGAGTLSIDVQAAPLPIITLEATGPAVIAGSGQTGEFTLTRSGDDLSAELVVQYLVKGSATPGVDYQALKGTKKMKAGKASVKLKVTPLGDLGGAGKKIVKLTLQPGEGYAAGTSAPQKVKILSP